MVVGDLVAIGIGRDLPLELDVGAVGSAAVGRIDGRGGASGGFEADRSTHSCVIRTFRGPSDWSA